MSAFNARGAGMESGTGLPQTSDADLDSNYLKAILRCIFRRVGKLNFLFGNQVPGDYLLDLKLGSTRSVSAPSVRQGTEDG